MSDSMLIFIPSRGRAENIPHVLSLLPTAYVVVDQAEREAYAAVTPKDRLILHPGMEGGLDRLSKIRNWCLGKFQEECLVNVDDDLTAVRAFVGRASRKITEPDAIYKIIFNAYMCCKDLNLSAFGWCRDVRVAIQCFLPHDPISLTGPLSSAVGIVGRKYAWDSELMGRTDAELTLQVLKTDRILLHDRRYYFDFGRIWAGKGGNSGKRTKETELQDMKIIKDRWGGHIGFSSKSKAAGSAFSVRVERKAKEFTDYR